MIQVSRAMKKYGFCEGPAGEGLGQGGKIDGNLLGDIGGIWLELRWTRRGQVGGLVCRRILFPAVQTRGSSCR